MGDLVYRRGQREVGIPKFDVNRLKKVLVENANYKSQTKEKLVEIENIILEFIGKFFNLHTSNDIVDVGEHAKTIKTIYYTYDELLQQFNNSIYDRKGDLHYKRDGLVSHIIRKTHNKFSEKIMMDSDKEKNKVVETHQDTRDGFVSYILEQIHYMFLKKTMKHDNIEYNKNINMPYELLSFKEIKNYLSILDPILQSLHYEYNLKGLKKFFDMEQEEFLEKHKITSKKDLISELQTNGGLYWEINNYKVPESFKEKYVVKDAVAKRKLNYPKTDNKPDKGDKEY